MTARLLDGKGLALQMQAELRDEVAAFIQQTGVTPGLDVVLVGENPASEVYVRNKHTATEKAACVEHCIDCPRQQPRKSFWRWWIV